MKEIKEIHIIKKKIDIIMEKLGSLKNSGTEEPEFKATKQTIPIDGKYLEISVYNEFLKNNKNQLDHINARIDELRKMIDEILLELKKKVNEKDLKNLEGKLGLIKNSYYLNLKN